MNLYLISNPTPASYDVFRRAVVAAESERDARLAGDFDLLDTWVVQLIGTADPSVEPGIVLASYDRE